MAHIALPVAPVPSAEPRMLPEIYKRLGEACADEAALEHSWVSLGALLLRYKNSVQWQEDGFESFDTFMETLRERFKRGRTQLRGYLGVAEYFLPTIDAETLEAIGISNAMEMRRQSKLAGKPVPTDIVLAAKGLTTKELRAKLAQAFCIQDVPSGTWFDFQGTYFTPEQRKEFKDAVKIAMKVLGIKPNVPDHIARGEIMLAFAKEFFGTHAPEVYGQQQAGPDAETLARYKRLGDHADFCEQCALFISPTPCAEGRLILEGVAVEMPVFGDEEPVWVGISVVDQKPCEVFRNHKLALDSLHGADGCIVAWPYKSAVEIIRRKVFERDNYICTNCADASLTWGSAHMHEKIWRSKGGNISVANGVTLCYTCHIKDEDAGHGKRQPQWSASSGKM